MEVERLTADTFEQAVEALVFASDVALRASDIARVYGDVTGAEVPEADVEAAVGRLNGSYREAGRAVRIEAWGGGYRMATTDAVAPFVRALFDDDGERRLSRSLLETLAVIAYKQPATKPEVDHVRGVASDYALRQLLERGFVEIAGRADSIGRPLLYATTPFFLDQFGLADLDALPTPREIEEILADPTFNKERAKLLSELVPTSGQEPPSGPEDAPEAAAPVTSPNSPDPKVDG
ncbi:MAG: SMC-Scp complex subunit ScpB [Bacteroidota bacterium]